MASDFKPNFILKKDFLISALIVLIGGGCLWALCKATLEDDDFPDYRGISSFPTTNVTFPDRQPLRSNLIDGSSYFTSSERYSTSPNSYFASPKNIQGVYSSSTAGGTSSSGYSGNYVIHSTSSQISRSYSNGSAQAGGATHGNNTHFGTSSYSGGVSISLLPIARADAPSLTQVQNGMFLYATNNISTSVNTMSGPHRVPYLDPVTGKYYDTETGEECDPPGSAVGYVDPETGKVWNGTGWIDPPEETFPLGDIPWLIIAVLAAGYVLIRKSRLCGIATSNND